MNTDKHSKMRIHNLLAVIGLALLLTAGLGGTVSAASAQVPALEKAAEMHDEPGVLIVSVLPESPADEAGLSRGDIVLAVDEEPVDDAESFAKIIGALEAGDEVVLTALHGDDTLELSAVLGQRNGRTFLGVVPYVAEDLDVDKADPESDEADTDEADAMPEDAITEDDDVDGPDEEGEESTSPRTRMHGMMPFGQGGALISQVVSDGPAAEAGLMAGDLIVAVDGEALGESADLADLIGGYAPGDEITLTVHNVESNEKLEVPVTLGAHPDDDGRAFLGVAYMPVPTMPGLGDILPEYDADEKRTKTG